MKALLEIFGQIIGFIIGDSETDYGEFEPPQSCVDRGDTVGVELNLRTKLPSLGPS